ncbi:MAG: tetratricopeptide repeat protein [Pirellulaceae bacterium]
MSAASRRQKIEAMLAEDPHDTFLRYSLAMELQKEGDYEASLRGFGSLMRDDPPHVPAFFMAAQLYAKLGRAEEARAALRDGIVHSQAQGNEHAASEMSEYLLALGTQDEAQ